MVPQSCKNSRFHKKKKKKKKKKKPTTNKQTNKQTPTKQQPQQQQQQQQQQNKHLFWVEASKNVTNIKLSSFMYAHYIQFELR